MSGDAGKARTAGAAETDPGDPRKNTPALAGLTAPIMTFLPPFAASLFIFDFRPGFGLHAGAAGILCVFAGGKGLIQINRVSKN